MEEIARIDLRCWLVPSVKIRRNSRYSRCVFSPQTAGSAIMLSSLTNCFIIFKLQFHQKDNLSRNREGDHCIYIRVPRHPSGNEDVVQTSLEVTIHQ